MDGVYQKAGQNEFIKVTGQAGPRTWDVVNTDREGNIVGSTPSQTFNGNLYHDVVLSNTITKQYVPVVS